MISLQGDVVQYCAFRMKKKQKKKTQNSKSATVWNKPRSFPDHTCRAVNDEVQTHLHSSLFFLTGGFFSLLQMASNYEACWKYSVIKSVPPHGARGAVKTPPWLSYAIVCPHMQNNNGSRPARHPPFTWVSYSAIISLSFLTFAWDDMLGRGRNRAPAIRGQESQSRPLQRCCRPPSSQSSPGSWAAVRRVSSTQDYARTWNSWEVGAQRRGPWGVTSRVADHSSGLPARLRQIEKQLTFWWTFQRLRERRRLLRQQLLLHNNVQTAFSLPLSLSLFLPHPLSLQVQCCRKGWMEVNAQLLPPRTPPQPLPSLPLFTDDLRFVWVNSSTALAGRMCAPARASEKTCTLGVCRCSWFRGSDNCGSADWGPTRVRCHFEASFIFVLILFL